MSEHVMIERRGGILSIILNRPDKKNALSNAMYEQISDGFRQATSDSQVRVVLLKSSSPVFTSGNDLKDFAAVAMGQMDLSSMAVVELIELVIQFEKPLVAAVNGPAVGIGTTILMHCDVVIAGPDAVFHLPFIHLGLVPEFASTYLLPRLAGRVRASHTLMLGEPFDRNRAKELGIVSLECEDAELDQVATAQCRKLASLPPATLRSIKALINPPDEREKMAAAIKAESGLFAKCLASDEHREALQAFFEKRKADFSRFS